MKKKRLFILLFIFALGASAIFVSNQLLNPTNPEDASAAGVCTGAWQSWQGNYCYRGGANAGITDPETKQRCTRNGACITCSGPGQVIILKYTCNYDIKTGNWSGGCQSNEQVIRGSKTLTQCLDYCKCQFQQIDSYGDYHIGWVSGGVYDKKACSCNTVTTPPNTKPPKDTPTPSNTKPPKDTPTPSDTKPPKTPTNTPKDTPTPSDTRPPVSTTPQDVTDTPTITGTRTTTPTPTPTITGTRTATPTPTPTITGTRTVTPTPLPTLALKPTLPPTAITVDNAGTIIFGAILILMGLFSYSYIRGRGEINQ